MTPASQTIIDAVARLLTPPAHHPIHRSSHAKARAAYRSGSEARRAGKAIYVCPHVGHLARIWAAGFRGKEGKR